MYSLEQLKIFVAVCETGSFSAAARKLKRAQSGVSQSIANLEISINQELFDRSLNKPTLTVEGIALLPLAQSILNQTVNFEQKIESLDKQHEHSLVFAIEESFIDNSLLIALSQLADEFPSTIIEIVATSTFDVERMVSEGKAQIGIIYADGKMQNTMDFFNLGHNRFATVVSPTHPLTLLASVKESDLRSHRQVAMRSSEGKQLWFSYAISTKVWYANNHKTIAGLVEQGVGWAMIPEQLANDYINAGQLVSLNLEFEPNGWITTIDCITSRSHAAGPVLNAALTKIRQHMLNPSKRILV
ncbi:LysR family transcriptional regulator [Psychromonas marina]|uniref:LysR family transcriptional regulator n=1 Tax=Psychromonas marina TaxID=88364 RepID=A0ABQ6E4U7_9GAMM|nr:LysR family transcriptional regulator [Psychromonas marina]GLS92350.1 LysR family transcriptional regulator [Psychromonas marina]